MTKKGKWGKNALWPIKGHRIAHAFKKNISSAHVWAPIAGAGVIHLGNFDRKISAWATEKKYIYGSKDNTSRKSDQFNDILEYQMYASILFTSSMDEDKSLAAFAAHKAKGTIAVVGASKITGWGRHELAPAFKRQRPNKYDHRSFPSGHSNEAGSRNALIRKNLESVDANETFKTSLNVVNTSIAGGTLWARLEGQNHYPTDVLVGYAFGTFLSGFIYDSIMNLDESESLVITPTSDSFSAMYVLNL